MTDKNDSPSGNLWLPYVLVLVLMAAGIAVGPQGKSPLRPQITNLGREDTIPESQNIPARLWQDPFEATSTAREAFQGIDLESPAARNFLRLSDLVRQHTTKDRVLRPDGSIDYHTRSHRVLFHFVSLPSDAYPEAGEQRIRTRVAVISALSTAGYRPTSAARLGIATWNASDPGMVISSQKAYPFEVFEFEPARNFMVPKQERLGRKFDEVVVIYVEDGSIQPRHQLEWLKRLSRLLADATPLERLRSQWVAAGWLGPISSDRIITLLRAAGSQLAEDGPNLHADPSAAVRITILAVRPTIEPSFVSRIMRPEVGTVKRIPERVVDEILPASRRALANAIYTTPRRIPLAFYSELPESRSPWLAFLHPRYIPLRQSGNTLWSPWLTLERIGCDDALLAQALARELTLRRPRLFEQEPKGSVALVSEWDTLYGRALPQSFEEAFTQAGGKAAQLHRFTYLRGLDGQITGALESPKSEKATTPESPDLFQELLKSRAPSIAFGRTQVDYVDRLAAQLQTIQRTRPEQRLEAVGILGSDTYDKLLILQGLRKVFPSVQYFTTELDASLFAPEHYKVTRNLLIATGFDLQLYEEYQESILPFRDSSQASLYFGTLRALQYFAMRKNQGTVRPALDSWKPALVEIGRNGPYLLDPTSYAESPGDDGVKARSPLPDAHQSVRAWWRRFLFPLAALVIVVASMLTQVGQLTVERAVKTLSVLWQQHIHLLRWKSVRRALARPRLQVTKDIAMWSVIFGGIFFIWVAAAIPWIAERTGEEPLYIAEGISSWPATWLRALGVFLCACYFWIIVRQFRQALNEGTKLLRIEPEGCPPKKCPDRPTPCEAWDRFSARSRGGQLKMVIVASWVIYCVLATLLFANLNPPANVTRGPSSIFWEKTVLRTVVFSMHLLSFIP